MKNPHRRLAAVAAALCVAPTLAASELETVLVTGTYVPRPELTASTTVLDQARIEALNKRNLAGLLQTVPGLLVEEQGGPGGLTAVSVRGGEANFTLVLLDGVPVNDPTNSRGGSFDFASLNSALIERVEVVRGSRSAVYGSDALAGVINIVTREPVEAFSHSLVVDAGEDDFLNTGLSLQGRSGGLDYTLELNHRDDGDPTPGSERETDSANLRLGWNVAPGHRLSLGYRYIDGDRSTYPEQSGGPELATSDDLDETDYQDTVYSAAWTWDISDRWRSRVSGSRFDHEETFDSPGIPPFFEVPPNGTDTEFTRDNLQWVNTLQVSDNASVNVGADFRAEDGDSEGYVDFFGFRQPTDYELDRDTVGYFIDVSARPWQSLLLQAGARYDDPDGFDSETTWQAGASFDLSPRWRLAANYGEAFKLPSFFALGNALVGNPDLEPERAESWDASVTWQPADSASLSLTGFFNDFEDLVDFDDETFRNVNRQNVETSGAELEGRWQVSDDLLLTVHGTYTDIDVKGEDTTLTGRPEWSGGAAAQWQFAPAFSTTLDYRYGGEQFSVTRHTGQEMVVELDDYHRFDWVLAWQAAYQWRFTLSVDNLLDEDYETAVGFPAPERQFRVGVRYGR